MATEKLKVKIATPERIVVEGTADKISLPTKIGEITILPNHVSLITTIAPGVINTSLDGKEYHMAVSGGFLEFHDNELVLLADTAERSDEIDFERAEQARKQAEELKRDQSKIKDESQYAMVVSRIEKQLARIRVFKKYSPKAKKGIHLEE